MKTVVLASGNSGKLRELTGLLAPLQFDLRLQSEFEVEEAQETGTTFVENALIKARHASTLTGHAAIADDSGLVVPSLDGLPGVRSARFAGDHASDSDNNALLLERIQGLSRDAYFVCVLVFMDHALDPTPLIAMGRWFGEIIDEPRGEHGFGYDPLFYVRELDCTSAELEIEKKNEISHRARAAHQLFSLLTSDQ